MKNQDKWIQKRFKRDNKGRIIGTHNHKIIGNAYEPIIRKYSKGKLLDLGCGDVPYYHMYKNSVSEVVCVDWGSSSLDISHLDIEADLNEGLPFFEKDEFDTIICTDVLEHIHEPEILFSEISRVLKPKGNLILAVPFLYWIHSNPHDYHRYSRFKLENFCKKNKLQLQYIEEYGGLPEILFDLISKGYHFFNLPLNRLFQKAFFKIGLLLHKLKFVKNWSSRSRNTFPLGYILVASKK